MLIKSHVLFSKLSYIQIFVTRNSLTRNKNVGWVLKLFALIEYVLPNLKFLRTGFLLSSLLGCVFVKQCFPG